MVSGKGIDIKRSLADAFLAGIVALVLFGPIVGLVLDRYSFKGEPGRLLFLVGLVFFGRLASSIFFQTTRGIALLETLARGRSGGVNVRLPGATWVAKYMVPFALLSGLVLPFVMSKYWVSVLILALIYVLLGLGLNIVVGLAGLLDLGFVAFYAIGAYGLALGHLYLGLGFWTMLPLAVVFAALAGMLLGFPVLRMHGDYLAIVTLGFGEIIRLLLNNWIEFTGGPNGVSAPLPTLFGLEFKRRAVAGGIPFHEYFGLEYSSTYRFIFIYFILFITLWIVLYFKHRLVNMPVGRAWEALREDEIACRSLGLNHVLIKLSAFMIGASIGGVAGVFFATYQGFINPSSFTFIESALILAIVVLGGLGSTLGVAVAALVLTILPEALREFADYRVLIFGMLMVLMMIWKPRGLIRSSRPSFNLADEGK